MENGEKRAKAERKDDKDNDNEGGEKEEEEERERKTDVNHTGHFEDLVAADACLTLGKSASDPDMGLIAFKKAAEIASFAVSRYILIFLFSICEP